jgi:exodeoxyribonuclease VII large subunit
MSPLRVLERGYAVATRAGHVVTAAEDVAVGEVIDVRLARGALTATVTARREPEPASGPASGPASDRMRG